MDYMIKPKFYITLLCICLTILGIHTVNAQTNLTGFIHDDSSGNGIPYVNIGVLYQGVGTVTDTTGKFVFLLKNDYTQDSVRISSIGYQSKTLSVPAFKKLLETDSVISLSPVSTLLPEVAIANRKLKKETIGNDTQSESFTIGFSSNLLGNEVGVRMKIKKPTKINAFNTYIVKNEYGKVKFRLNIYDIKDGSPNRSILKENIFIETDIKSGPLSVDLSQYDIRCEDDIVVSLEWIEDLGEKGLNFSASFLGKPAFFRTASQGAWEKSGTFSVGFSLDVES